MRKRGLIVVATVLSALLYCTWPLTPLLNPGLPATSAYMSEYGALGQPHAQFFNGLDAATAILTLLVAAWGMSRFPRNEHRLLWLVFVGELVQALSSVVSAICPMTCASSVPGCPIGDFRWPLPVRDAIHEIFSTGGGIALFAAGVLSVDWALRHLREAERAERLWMIAVVVLGLLSVYSTLAVVVSHQDLGTWGPLGDHSLMVRVYFGYWQRVYISVTSLWWIAFVLAALEFDRRPSPAAPPARPSDRKR